MLENLARRLSAEHPGVAASLREGLDETLTVKRLGLSDTLERALSTTNLIENLIRSSENALKAREALEGRPDDPALDRGRRPQS